MTEFGRRRPASDFTLNGEGLKIKRQWVGSPSDSFRNPTNNYVENFSLAWLWCLLFGSFYFAFRGVWMHAILSAVLAIVTGGLSWLFYPFFARRILINHYLREGWI